MKTLISAGIMALMAGPTLAADWTGGYLGLGVGYGDVSVSGGVQGGNDVTYGIHGGYDYDFGDWVVGAELEYDRADIAIAGGAQNVDNVGRLKFKAGYDFGSTLGYLVLGAARASTTLGNDTGAIYGLGLAYQVNPQWTVSGEVLRHDFNNFNGTGLDVDADTINVRVSMRF
ncbi:outer membrane protein [Arenibacterium sp. CAU 1754]